MITKKIEARRECFSCLFEISDGMSLKKQKTKSLIRCKIETLRC